MPGPQSIWGEYNSTTYGQFTASSATQIVGNTPNRAYFILYNNSANILYLGKDSSVTSSTGFPVPAGGQFVDRVTKDAWFGLPASGSADARWEHSSSQA